MKQQQQISNYNNNNNNNNDNNKYIMIIINLIVNFETHLFYFKVNESQYKQNLLKKSIEKK